MRKFTITTMLFLCLLGGMPAAEAQNVPSGMSYQAIMRNSSSELLTNKNVGVRIRIRQRSSSGNIVYAETHETKTNGNGVLSLVIGNGIVLQGNFQSIDWSDGPFFVQTETDPNGGTNYTISSTTQLLSVPFAYYAAKAGDSFSGDYNDLKNVPSDLVKSTDLAPVAVSGSYEDLRDTPDMAGYLTDEDLAPVAFTSNYSDLQGAPAKVSDLPNDAGYLTNNTFELIYDTTLGLGIKGGQNYVTLPFPKNISELNNDKGFLDNQKMKESLTISLSRQENGTYTLQLSDGKDNFGDAQIIKVPVKTSELENDAAYLKSVDLSLSYKNNELKLTNATNETESKVTLPSQLSEFENDMNFIERDKIEFRLEDGNLLVLRDKNSNILANIRLPEGSGEGTVLPSGVSKGDLLFWDNNEWTVLPAGLEGQVLTYTSSGLTWSNPTVFDEKETYAEGDIFVNSQGVTEGVIINVDPMTRTGLLVSLKDYSDKWSLERELINANDMENGWNNLSIVAQNENWKTMYPAFATVSSISDEKWYIPSVGELKNMIDNLNTLNLKLKEAGGTEMSALYYMSSTERIASQFLGIMTADSNIEGNTGNFEAEEDKVVIDSQTPGDEENVIFHYELKAGDTIFIKKDVETNMRPVRKLSWTELNSKSSKNKLYKVGDIYYASDNQTPLGVVFEVTNNGMNGKMVSLTEDSMQWYALTTDTIYHSMTSLSGMDNSLQLSSKPGFSETNYPAVSYCLKTVPWYMPSYYELLKLFSNYSAVSETLEKMIKDGNNNVVSLKKNAAYFSSTENMEDGVHVMGVSLKDNGEDPEVQLETLLKTEKHKVRAIRDF